MFINYCTDQQTSISIQWNTTYWQKWIIETQYKFHKYYSEQKKWQQKIHTYIMYSYAILGKTNTIYSDREHFKFPKAKG